MALNSSTGGGSAGAVRAGRAFVELFTKNSLAAGLNAAAADLKAFGRNISSIGLKFAGLGAIGAGALLPMTNTLSDLAKQGSIANALGLTSEQFTGIAGVAKSVGNDTKEFIESLVTLGKLGTDAAAGTEQASQAFAAMGLNANEFIKLRADEQFFAVFDAMNKMQDPLQRTRALMLAFGEDGGKILLPLLGKSGDELRRMAAGFAISSDDMRDATKASTAYATATQTLSKAWQAVSIAAAPIVKILADGLSAAVAPVTEFVKQNREMVVGLSLAVGGVAALGVGMVAVGTAVSALGASWAAFTGIVSGGMAVLGAVKAVLLTPILAIPAALAAAGAYFLTTSESIRGSLSSVFNGLKASWSEIVQQVQAGDLQTAFSLGIDALKVEWLRFQVFLNETWGKFVDGFMALWNKVTTATAIALTNIGKRLGIYTADEAKGIVEQLLQMEGENNKARNPERARAMVEIRGELADAIAWRDWNLKEAKAKRVGTDWFGGGAEFGANPMAAQLNSIAMATRGTFGGGASSGFFGGSGGIGEKLLTEAKKANEIGEETNKLLAKGNLAIPGGGLLFVGGK